MTVFVIADSAGRLFSGYIVDETGRHLDDNSWSDDPARAWEFDTRAEAEAARPDETHAVLERFYDDEGD